MGKKAKRNYTPEQPPLGNDVHWIPLLHEVRMRKEKIGDTRLAITGIENELRAGKRRSKRWDRTTGEWETLQPEHWEANIIYYEEKEPSYLCVIPGPKDERRWNLWASDPGEEDGGHVYFVSQSDDELLRSAPHAQAEKPNEGDATAPAMRSAPPAKPGTKPREDWPTKLGAWLILKTYEDPRQLDNIDALVGGAQDHLQDEIGWAPESSGRVRKQILDFLQLIRR